MAERRLALKLVLLLAPAVAVVALNASRVDDAVRFVSPFRHQILEVQRAGPAVRAVGLGDSHAGMGLRPLSPQVWSLAFIGENVPEMRTKFTYIAPRLPRLRAVLVQAQPHQFFAHRDRGIGADHAALASAWDTDNPVALLLDPCCRGELPGVMLRLLAGLPPPPTLEIGPRGYLRFLPTVRESLDAGAAREVSSYGALRPAPALRAAFEDLVRQVRARNVEVVLTRYPLSPAYRRALPADVVREADAYLGRLAQRERLIECGGWDAVDDDALFFNADHLNEHGAEVYWPVLAGCLRPYVGAS